MRRPLIAAGLTAALLLAAAPAAVAGGDDHGHEPDHGTDAPLRDLAAEVGLRVGVAVNTDLLASDAAHTAIVNREFSSVTPENVMKWQLLEPEQGVYDWEAADRLVASAEANGQLVRGHTLTWHSQTPAWLSADGTTSTFSDEELRALLEKHVKEVAGHYRGQIWQWDVVNEAFNEDGTPRDSVWYRAWGNSTDYIADSFRWAHEADPGAQLFYNDYNLEGDGPKSDAANALVKDLQAQGVPIDGVGFQTHLSTEYPMPDLRAQLERFAALGIDVALTEVDVRTAVTEDGAGGYTDVPASDLGRPAQEAYWSQSLQACLLVQRCVSWTTWGVSDAQSWIPGVFPGEGAALLWDAAYQPKPEYTVVQRDLELADGAPHRSGSGS